MEQHLGIKKHERLKSEKRIQHLFVSNEAVFKYPIKMVFAVHQASGTEAEGKSQRLRFTVTVRKKNIRQAVDRNLIKRRMREAFRLNKDQLNLHLFEQDLHLDIILAFVGKNVEPFALIEKGLLHCFKQLKGLHLAAPRA